MNPNVNMFGYQDQDMNAQNNQFMNQQAQNRGFNNFQQTGGYMSPFDSRLMASMAGSNQPPPNFNQPSFVGKFVGNANEIVMNDVPMDGRPAIFPFKDWSAILVKTWKPNGQLVTVRYVIDPDQFQEEQAAQNELDDIRTRLETIEQSLKKQSKSRTTQNGGDVNG